MNIIQTLIRNTATAFRIVGGVSLFALATMPDVVQAQLITPEYEFGGRLWTEALASDKKAMFDSLVFRADRLVVAYPQSPARDAALFKIAEQSFQQEQWQEVHFRAEALRKQNPSSALIPHSFYLEGEVEFVKKDYKKAAKYFAQAAESAFQHFAQRPDSSYPEIAGNALFWQGIARMHEQEFDSAKQSFLQLAERLPQHLRADDALFLTGTIEERKKQYASALSYYNTVERTYPNSNTRLAALLRAAHLQIRLRQGAAALGTLESVETVLQTPDSLRTYSHDFVSAPNEELLYLRGEGLLLVAKPTEARQQFTTLLQQNPTSVLRHKALLGLGRALLDVGLCSEALQQYALILDDKNVEPILTDRARLYRTIALKQCNDRQTAYKELAALTLRSDFPFTAEALLELGQMYYEDKEYDKARKVLERGVKERATPRTQALMYYLAGSTALESGFFASAATYFASTEDVARSAPDYELPQKAALTEEVRFKRGIAEGRARRFRDGITTLNSYLADYPKGTYAEETAFWLAEFYYGATLMANAEEAYKNFLQKYPRSQRKEDALYGLGWSYFRRKDFTRASTTFERLLREHPKTDYAIDVLTRKGDGFWLSKQYRAAADSYRQGALRAPNTEQGQYCAYQLGRALYAMDAFSEAITAMQSFARKYSSSSLADDALFTVGWIHFQQRNHAAAVESFKQFLDRYPSSPLAPRVQYAIGDAYYNLGEYDAAVAAYRTTAEKYPQNPAAVDAVTSLQYTLTALGKEDDAALVAEEFVQKNPGSYSAQEVRFKNADMFLTSGRYSSAAAEFEAYLRQAPEGERAPEAMFQLARSRFSMGETESALSQLQQIETKYPSSEYAHKAALEQAVLTRDMGNTAKADSLFLTVQKKYPGSSSAIQSAFEMAFDAEKRADTSVAMQRYIAVSEAFPDTEYGARSRYRVGMHYRSLRQFDTARSHFVLVAQRNDELGAEALYRVGEMYLRTDSLQAAVATFLAIRDRFSRIEDWHTLAMMNLGEVYQRLNQINEAKEIYRLVITIRKEDDFGKEAEERLKKLQKL